MNRREFLCAGAAAGCAFSTPAPAALAEKLIAIHTMVDMPEWAEGVGTRWDAKAFVRASVEAGVEVIELKTKNAMGHAAFPFKDRKAHGDWTTETRKLARDAGLPFMAYYNVGLDNWMAKRKPEWRCVDAAGKEKIAFGAYNWMCLRSPWRDVVLSEIRQVAEAIRPEGFWFDLLGMPNAYSVGSFDPAQACFCAHCREAYRKAFGEEQPLASNDPAVRMRVNRFGHRARIEMLRDAMNVLAAVDPAMVVGYNGAGFRDQLTGTPAEIRARVGLHSTEAKPHRLISFVAKSMWAMGKPYQVHSYGSFMRLEPGNAVGTWSAWNLIPPSYMKVSAAVATAHAGRISVGVNPLPDGTFVPDELRNLAPCFRAVKERERFLVGLESVPDVALVYDAASELGLLPLVGASGQRITQEATGLHNALADSAMHFDIVNAASFDPARYRVILIGDAVTPPDALLARLTAFVERGGLLIVTHETSLGDGAGKRRDNFAWADLLGVRFTGVSPFREANYALPIGAPSYPMLFLCEVLEVACTTAQPLAELVYPEDHRTRDRFTDGETAYIHFKQSTGKPLMTLRQLGKGRVVYIAAPIGREIAIRDDVWLKRMLTGAIRKYGGERVVDVTAPSGVQAVFGRKRGMHVLSLVSLHDGMATGGASSRIGPVKARIPLSALPQAPKDVRFLDAANARWAIRDKAVHIDIGDIGHHALAVIA